jgi:hypothetical protein
MSDNNELEFNNNSDLTGIFGTDDLLAIIGVNNREEYIRQNDGYSGDVTILSNLSKMHF